MRTFPKLSKERNKFGYFEIHWSEMEGGQWRSKRKSTRTSDRIKAEEALAAFLTQRSDSKGEVPTLSDVVAMYLSQHSKPRGNEVSDSRSLRAPLGAFGDWPVTSIRNPDIQGYSRQRQAGKYGPKAVTPATVRREITAMQAAINWAVRSELVPDGAQVRFEKPQGGAVRDLWLTEQQQREILMRAPEAPVCVQVFLKIGLTYGVRRGAIMDLTWSQVDFQTRTIDFNRPDGFRNRKRRPVVPMTESIRQMLMPLAQEGGVRVCSASTPHYFRKFMAEIGYDWVTPHVLKHTAVTLMLRDGVDPGDVSKLTSTDLRTIYRVYRHHTHQELLTIAERRSI